MPWIIIANISCTSVGRSLCPDLLNNFAKEYLVATAAQFVLFIIALMGTKENSPEGGSYMNFVKAITGKWLVFI